MLKRFSKKKQKINGKTLVQTVFVILLFFFVDISKKNMYTSWIS